MCGIAGIFSKVVDPVIIRSMTDELVHRGPDAMGIYINPQRTVALGHTRLSIIDLSEAANQPMRLPGFEDLVIVFNGEIYNFKDIRNDLKRLNPEIRFKTNSDTEIILHAYHEWGNNMVSKLDGMFALAIYDRNLNKIFLCRDRIGKKPLFYYLDSNHFIFASEIKSLLKNPLVRKNLKINQQAINEFLHLGYIPGPKTIYDSIFKFPAGHYGWVNERSEITLTSYWNIDNFAAPVDFLNEKDSFSELKRNLSDAVQKRLISDVPLGAFLSGGTDSSLVSALASGLSKDKLKTFTIGFKEDQYDESGYARKVASWLHTDHHEYILSEIEAIGILEKYLRHFDEPFADTSAIPTMLVSELSRKEVKVALTGDGGDELFLGYGAYDWANKLENPLFRLVQKPFEIILQNSHNSRLNRISHMLRATNSPGLRSHIFSQEQYFFSQNEIRDKLLTHTGSFAPFQYLDAPDVHLTPAEKQALFDIKFYLKDDLLVKVDRASMFHGLECRCPFLDHHVAELAWRIPYRLKKKGNTRKWILKELLKDYLPDDLIFRPKWGFSIPLLKWMRNELHYLIDDFLNKECIEDIGLIHYPYVEKLKQSFLNGNDYLYNRLWVLIVLHKWIRENA